MKAPLKRIDWGGSFTAEKDKAFMRDWEENKITDKALLRYLRGAHYLKYDEFSDDEIFENIAWLGYRKGARDD